MKTVTESKRSWVGIATFVILSIGSSSCGSKFKESKIEIAPELPPRESPPPPIEVELQDSQPGGNPQERPSGPISDASPASARWLLETCYPPGHNAQVDRSVAFVDCRGYLSGAVDMALTFEQTSDSVNLFCQPRNGLSSDAWYEIMVRFAQKKPDMVETSARQFILFAMLDQMGC